MASPSNSTRPRVARASRSWIGTVAFGLLALASPVLASYPGSNGHIAYTKLVDKDTDNERRAVFIDSGQVSSPLPRGAGHNDQDMYPAFSPDGKQLAYVRQMGDTQAYVFYIANSDGTNARLLATLGDLDNQQAYPINSTAPKSLVWSPDGSRIGFVRTHLTAPLFVDTIMAVTVPDGFFQNVAADPGAGTPFPGFDWRGQGPGKVGKLLYRCGGANPPNILFCAADEGTNGQPTAYAPDSPELPAFNYLPANDIPQWGPPTASQGGDPRVLFLWRVPVSAGPDTLYVTSIFSMLPWNNFVDLSAIGSDLRESTPGRDTISCISVQSGVSQTFHAARYEYGNPVSSPDGNYFVAPRIENEYQFVRDGDNTSCQLKNANPDLLTFRIGGGTQGLIDTDIDASFGLAWQPSPANVSVTVTDGHDDELHGLLVELRDFNDSTKILYADPLNRVGGQYLFDSIPPGRYALRATLVDKESNAFEIRHDFPADEPVWAERQLVVPPDVEKADITFQFKDADLLNASMSDNSLWPRLDAMAAIFYQTRRFVDWLHINLTSTTGPKVPIHAFASQGGALAADLADYTWGTDVIRMGTGSSDYSERADGFGEAPVNDEWHEFSHHLQNVFFRPINDCAGDTNHAGYVNPDTCDSLVEGWAMLLPALANGSGRYASIYDFDGEIKAFGLRMDGAHFVGVEDGAAAALLWDLVAPGSHSESTSALLPGGVSVPITYNDNVDISLQDLWSILISKNPNTVAAFREVLDSDPRFSALTVDLDNDGVPDVTQVDQLFLMHGFFPIVADQLLPINAMHYTFRYNVEEARQGGSIFEPNDKVGQTGHSGFSIGLDPATQKPVNVPAIDPRSHVKQGARANLSVLAHEAAGKPLQNVDLTMTLHYPTFDRVVTGKLRAAAGNLVHLELPMYFDYLLPIDHTDLPPCDPAHDIKVTVTLTAAVNGFASADAPGFDNCTYVQAIVNAPGPAAMSFDLHFPEDSTAPVTAITTDATSDINGAFTDGSWTVTLVCKDPVVSGFASGCLSSEYSIDNAAFAAYSEPVTISQPGLHSFAYRSQDAAGNIESAQSVKLGVGAGLDLTPPVTTAGAVPSVPAQATNSTTGFWTVTLTCQDAAGTTGETPSGCASTHYSLDASSTVIYSAPIVIASVGTHTVQFGSVDAAGNAESVKSLQLSILASSADTDHDGVPDAADNCVMTANRDQRDSDGDGYGNACDADFNNNGRVDVFDLAALALHLGRSAATFPGFDLNGDGRINAEDLALALKMFGKAPGPSGTRH